MEDLKIILEGFRNWWSLGWRGRIGLLVLALVILVQIGFVVGVVYYGSKL